MEKKFLKVISLREVEAKISELFSLKTVSEELPVMYALNRFTFEDIYALNSVPPFKKSLADGYAIRFRDSKGASQNNPVMLRFAGNIGIGEAPIMNVGRGEAAFVPTGGVVPEGADSVVMLENSEERNGNIFIFAEASSLENVIEEGIDVQKGKLIMEKGKRITSKNIGLIRSAGYRTVKVIKPITVGIFSTGDELYDEEGSLPEGKIYDFNRYAIISQIKADSFNPTDYGIIKDDKETINLVLGKAIKENDLVLMSGGTSKGSFDFTVEVINSQGKPGVIVHGLNVSPGKPTVFGIVEGKLVAGLSGNPLASYLVYRIIVRELIFKKLGIKVDRTVLMGKLTENIPSRKGRGEFVLGKIFIENGENFIQPIFAESAFVSSLAISDGFIYISESKEGFAKGESVAIELW